MRRLSRYAFVVSFGALAAASFGGDLNFYSQYNIVSDGAVAAKHIDTNLVNPWGFSFGPGGPFWISDNGSNMNTIYNGSGNLLKIGGKPGENLVGPPTGQVFNSTTDFKDPGSGTKSSFIFATESGQIIGWHFNPTDPSVTNVLNDQSGAGAEYKGLAIGSTGGNNYLYGADFTNGRIDVFNGSNTLVDWSGAFADASVPSNYSPFNVQNLNGNLYVAYAVPKAGGDEVDGAGLGYVAEFNTDGTLVKTFQTGSFLNAPWGLALAPSSFGKFGGDLLVGNFGSGWIDAFNPTTGMLDGWLDDKSGNPIAIDGLWGIGFGNGGSGGSTNNLYFTAGLNGENDGLFGSLQAVPAPASALTMLFGLIGVRRRRNKR